MSNNLGRTEVAAAQNQKEVTINDSDGRIDAALTETLAVDVTSANAVVTTAQYQQLIQLNVTGATVAGRTVTLPAIKHFTVVTSASANTESFDVVVGTSTVTVPTGESRITYTDGTANGLIEVSGGAGGGGISGVRIEDEGVSTVAAATGINFAGAGVTVTDAGSNEATVTIPGGAGGTIDVEDEGVAVVTSGTLNFTGTGVTATDVAGVATIDVPAVANTVAVQEEGGAVVTSGTLNFTGTGVTATNVGGVATIDVPAAPNTIAFQDEGGAVVTSGTVNFVGAGVTTADVGGVATVTIPGGGGGATAVRIEDDGVSVVATANAINFAGAGVTVADAGSNEATVTIPGGAGGTVDVEDEGVAVVTSATLNFTGAGVTATDVAGVATIDVPAAANTVAVQDEGVAAVTSGTLNFVGAGVTATDVGGVATVTIPGGGGSGVAGPSFSSYNIEDTTNYVNAGLGYEGGSTLAPYTPLNMTSGTLTALDGSTQTGFYDTTSRPGTFLFRYPAGSTTTGAVVECGLRADAVPGASEQIILKVLTSASRDDGNNAYRVGLGFNNSDTVIESASQSVMVYLDGGDDDRIKLLRNSSLVSQPSTGTTVSLGAALYLRAVRSSTSLTFYASSDGQSWAPIGDRTLWNASYNNTWIVLSSTVNSQGLAGAGPVPITGVQWIRHVTGIAVDPW